MRSAHEVEVPQFQAVTSLTIFVAIGNCFDRPLFMISEEGTNSANVKKFLAQMLAARSEQDRTRPLRIILDGKFSFEFQCIQTSLTVGHPSHHCHANNIRNFLTGD